MLRKLIMLFVLVAITTGGRVSAQELNRHSLVGTMTAQSCQYFPTTADWLCWITVRETDTEKDIVIEVQGEAIGQAGQLGSSLPRNVIVKFVLEVGGIDFLRGVVRSQARGYYIYAF